MYAALLAALAEGHTVVTATNRLARTLQHHYDLRQLRSGASAWQSPDICTWPQWLQRLWDESRLRGGVAREQVLLDAPSASLLWRESLAVTRAEHPQLSTGVVARSARTAWKLVNDWDAFAAPEWSESGLGPDQRAWLRWSGWFRDRCAQQGWVDADRLPAVLLVDIRAGLFDGFKPVHLAGFETWPPAWLALTTALAERGVVIAEEPASTRNPANSGAGRPCSDERAELLAAARWARDCVTAKPDTLVGVVIPDLANRAAEVRRVFLDVFAPDWRINGVPDGLPLNVSFGQPLGDVPVIHTALLVLRLAGRQASFNDFSMLLRSPWLDGAAEEFVQRGRLDLELRRKLRQQFTLEEALPLCQKFAPRFAKTLTALLAPAEQTIQRSAPEWAAAFAAQLSKAGWPGRERDSAVFQACEAWRKLLGQFASSGGVLRAGLRRDQAIDWLSDLAKEQLFQPEGVADGVQVMGVLEATGLEFDHLWVCGMARELWPAASRPAVLIPLDLQRRLGMPNSTAANILDHANHVMQRLLACAPDTLLSWPEQQDSEALHPTSLAGSLLRAASLPQDTAADARLWNDLAASAGRTEVLEHDPPPALDPERAVLGGASVLNLQAVSPLNAFIERRLGAVLMESAPLGINARERGNVLHAALEAFYKANPNRAAVAGLDAAVRTAALTACLRAALEQLPGLMDPFMQTMCAFELRQMLPRLNAFVDLDIKRPDFEVIACEAKHSVSVGSLQLNIKLDRLDVTADGQKVVIDYKTGSVDRKVLNPAKPRDLQLPLYVTSVVPDAGAVAFAQISAQGVRFDGAGNATIGIDGIRTPGTRAVVEVKYRYPRSEALISSWEELRTVWAELVHELAEQFVAGDFRLDPRNPDSARGQFAVLSRIYDSGAVLCEDEDE